MLFVNFFLFFFAVIYSFYIPGRLVLEYVKTQLPSGNKFLLSFPIGVSLFLLGNYIFSWIGLPYVYFFILLGLLIFSVWKKRSIFSISVKNIDWLVSFIILFGSLSFLAITFLSGLKTSQGLQFIVDTNGTEALQHISYINNLLIHFPPNHQTIVNFPLRGYHYFYDFLLSRFVMFYHFIPFDLYFRFFTFFIAIFYGVGFYLISQRFTNSKSTKVFILFFAYFSQSAASFLSFFISVNPANGFGLIQPIEAIRDPSVIFSFGILLSSFYLLLEKKINWKWAIISGIMFGVLSESKFYAGFIGMTATLVFVIYKTVSKRKLDTSYFVLLITGIIISAITFLPNNLGGGGLVFDPFFFYKILMLVDFFKNLHWEIMRIIFTEHNNIPRLIILYLEAFGLFWIFALGVRLIFLLFAFKIFQKKFWILDRNVLLLSAIFIPFIIGSFFVQSVSNISAIQFLWFTAFLLAIPAGIVFGDIYRKIPVMGRVLLIIFLITYSWKGYWINIYRFYIAPQEKSVVSNEQLHMLQIISEKVPKNSYVVEISPSKVIFPGQSFEVYPYFAALANVQVYYEKEPLEVITPASIRERKLILQKINDNLAVCNKENISTLLKMTKSVYIVTYFPNRCLAQINLVKQKFESKQISLYILK